MRLSLSQKLSLGPVGMALLFGLLAFGYLLPRVEAAFDEQGQEIGASLPFALASTLTELLATHQNTAVQTALDGLIEQTRVAYVAVVAPSGEFIAVSGPLGSALREQREQLRADGPSHSFELQGAEILDMRAPVRDGALGRVHVGFNRTITRTWIQTVTWRFGIVLATALVLFVLAGYLASQRIVAPLLRLTVVARRIADEGDLREPIQIDSQDEVGQLAQAFSSMVDRLKRVLHELQSSSEMMIDSVRTLNQSAEDQTQIAGRYANALQETQVTAQEIHQTSLMASKTAEAVLEVAARADELGQTGEAAITESINGMVELREQVKQIEQQIVALSNRTQQIGGITQTVKDLADQSNMLALNAAIEAVRSGEHGKGFGVVAREIRALADQSIRATGQVRELLADISSAIATTVRITGQGSQRMEVGLAQIRHSGDTLRALSTIVHDNASSVRQIANTVSQQTIGIEQISSAVSELNLLMSETLQRITHSSDSVETLRSLSERVSKVVRDYRV